MALSFSEGSIGGDIERVSLSRARGVLRQAAAAPMTDDGRGRVPREPHRLERHRHRADHTRGRQGAAADQPAHLVLLPRRAADDQRRRAQRLRRATWGQFFIYQGFNENAGWMHTSSGVDNIDEFAETDRDEATAAAPTVTATSSGRSRRRRSRCPTARPTAGMAKRSFTIYRTHHGPIVREADGKWIACALMQEPVEALEQSFLRTKATRLSPSTCRSLELHSQLVEQHALRRRRRATSRFHAALHAEARRPVRLSQAGRRQRSGDRLEGLHSLDEMPQAREPAERLGLQHQQLAVVAPPGRTARSAATIPRYVDRAGENPRGLHADPGADRAQGLHAETLHRRRLRQLPARVRRAAPAGSSPRGTSCPAATR